jgi:uncharacterized protein
MNTIKNVLNEKVQQINNIIDSKKEWVESYKKCIKRDNTYITAYLKEVKELENVKQRIVDFIKGLK